MEQLAKQVQRLKESGRRNIVILRPFSATDDKLYQDLEEVCAELGTTEIVDEIFLHSYEAMGRGLVDILIVPELERIHEWFYHLFRSYIREGGAVILACRDYFMTGKALNDKVLEDIMEESFFRDTVATLGIKPYSSDVAPVFACADEAFISGGLEVKGPLPRAGVQLSVGSGRVTPQPPDGNMFIERYEVLRNYDAVVGCDAYGKKVNTLVNFAQNWENGARFVLYSSNEPASLIRKENPLFEATLQSAIRFCSNKVFAVSCASDYACYRQGEDVSVTYEVKNTDAESQAVDIRLEILGLDGALVFENQSSVILEAGSSEKRTVLWKCDGFTWDSYSVVLSICKDGQLLSRAENGFVVWEEAVVKDGPAVALAGKYFEIGEKRTMIIGTNYIESNLGEMMWIKPNIKKLEADFKQMAEAGINFVRIHYNHAKWFKDYQKACAGRVLEYYEDVEEDYLPNERLLRIFDAHIYLSQKYHMIYGGDLFTLLPEEMGDPKGWFGLGDYFYFEEKRIAQKEFLDILIPRYLDVPGIAWDLFNEPCGVWKHPYNGTAFVEGFKRWAEEIKGYMRELGDKHLITVGAERPGRIGEVSDFYAEHCNFKFIRERKIDTTLPEIIQECWMDRMPTPVGEQQQMGDMKQTLTDILELGFGGLAPWQWTNQLRLWNDSKCTNAEVWDDRLGTCVRNDGTLKPAGRFYRDFAWFIEGLDFLSCENGTITTKQGTLCVEQEKDGSKAFTCYENGVVTRKLAPKALEGGTLSLSTDGQADLFYLSASADTDYVKANREGVLHIETNRIAAGISVCEKPGGAEIAVLDAPNSREVRLTVRESDINYWFKLTYNN